MKINCVSSFALQTSKSVCEVKENKTPFTSNPVNNLNICSLAAANAVKAAQTIAFKANLRDITEKNTENMYTCGTEQVGEAVYINGIAFDKQYDLNQIGDTEKRTGKISDSFIRYSLSRKEGKSKGLHYSMAVRDGAQDFDQRTKDLMQHIRTYITPTNVRGFGTQEQVYVINTKGNRGDNFVTVIEDGDDVILTNAGKIKKKDESQGVLEVEAEQKGNEYKSFKPENIKQVSKREKLPSIGKGGKLVVGLEKGRFVKENLASLKEFKRKIDSGEIVLQQFIASPNAQDIEFDILAGGYGSRAEYTNASSDAILHGIKDGAQATKGVHRMATGLTPMETTLITLHNAGLVDCNNIEFGENINFYLNKTGINRGNGGYCLSLANKMDGEKPHMILSNDAVSRMTKAYQEACDKMASGKAALVIVAKKVPSKDCIKSLGIMQINDNNEILSFAEKPVVIPEGFEDKDKNCLTNTFHFIASNEAYQVLELMEPFFSKTDKNKETRDWSKQYIPILQTLTQDDDIEAIKEKLAPVFKVTKRELEDNRNDIVSVVNKAKEILNGQKIYAVPTDEPWTDCGTLNQLYYTTMQIVNNSSQTDKSFPLEDFEIAHAQSCCDPAIGLVASNPEQLQRIKEKYDIEGQVMVVPRAKKINTEDIADIPVIINE